MNAATKKLLTTAVVSLLAVAIANRVPMLGDWVYPKATGAAG